MSRKLFSVGAVATLIGSTALADVPGVATDIAPVHSLVARVMEGLGTPELVIAQGASPHEYSLRPSEAGALQEADLVFWIGEDLTPWMEGAIDTLTEDAAVIALLDAEGATRLAFRESALFEAHDHGDEHEDHDDHEHEHDDHAHEEDHDGHAHGEHDPHAWLSPENAAVWLNVIAAALSAADPDNAGGYYANAAAGIEELTALSDEVSATLDPVRGESFVVFHDAYQYFETAFDFPASGAISLSDASDPSPARIAEIQGRIADEGIACVLSEPQFNQNLVATVMDGTEARTAVLDPLGADIELGPEFYPQLLRNLANSLAECL
ncbi:zinc ABC transporter substrate-binding protein [Roseovarius sp. 2305UL8-3]|uniref:zinc ABC transporter substrate-binding protein n=1 Tax=Roseovarius conchicola TaxID=3121636 RepID=UPI0035279A8E